MATFKTLKDTLQYKIKTKVRKFARDFKRQNNKNYVRLTMAFILRFYSMIYKFTSIISEYPTGLIILTQSYILMM